MVPRRDEDGEAVALGPKAVVLSTLAAHDSASIDEAVSLYRDLGGVVSQLEDVIRGEQLRVRPPIEPPQQHVRL